MRANKCSLKISALTSETYRQRISLFLLLFTLIFFLLSFAESHATVRYVSKTGLSIPPYTSWETAADSIQECINICVFGDTIYVANGVYQEQVVMIPGLSLIGSGSDSCQINTINLVTSQNFTSVSVAGNCLFKGFIIVVNDNSDEGIGIGGIGSVINSVISENRITTAYEGIYLGGNSFIYKNYFDKVSVGIDLFNSNDYIQNNIIYTDPNSQLAIIAGILVQAFTNDYTPVIDSNYIVDHFYGINKGLGASPILKNNFILKEGGFGIFSGIGGNVKVFNNKIIANVGYDGIYKNGSIVQVFNNYITGPFIDYGILAPYDAVKNNVVTGAVRGIGSGSSTGNTIHYNNSWNNVTNYVGFTPDTTNLSIDPMILNDDTTKGKLDFHLQKYSPLIDAGDPTILDKDGTRSDIGLYGGPYGESYVYVDLPPRSPVNLTAAVDSSIVTLRWNKNTEADFSYYKLFYDTTKNFPADSTKLISSQPDTFYYFVIPPGTDSLYFKLTAVDNQGNESNPSEEVGVVITSVKDEWKPVNNYVLYQNYPNPFNPSTKIGYKLKERGYVKLYVYDIKGEMVSVLVNEVQEAGYYEVEFSAEVGNGQSAVGKSLASGIYIYQIFVRGENNIPVFSDIKKMIYVK